jgi:DNA invertase Pin-like site-specific DNA recombinase
MKRRGCAYVRVSKEREDGISPEQQEEKAELQAKLLGLDLIRVYQDIDISGRSDRRPAFQEMIRDIKAGHYDVCLVYKIDRFCRNVRDFHHYAGILDRYGCALVSISQNFDTSTPMGRLMRNILADFAQFESEMIGERVRDNKLASARRGKWTGGHVPYGYIFKDKKFEINPEESQAVALMYELRGKGWGFLRIAKEITSRGFRPRHGTRRGLHWSDDSIRYIIENPVYKGELNYEKVSVAGIVPAIVNKDTWNQAQLLKKLPGRSQQSQHILSGLLYCTHCGHSGWTITKNGRGYLKKDGTPHNRVLRYMCRTKRDRNARACACHLLDKTTLEDRVIKLIFKMARRDSIIKEFQKAAAEAAATCEQNDHDRIKAELDNLHVLMGELFSDYYDHRLITREQFAKKNNEYLEKEKLLSEKLQEIEAQPLSNIDLLAANINSINANWSVLTEGEKKIALRQVIRRIDVYPDRVEVDFFGIKKAIAPKSNSGATLLF